MWGRKKATSEFPHDQADTVSYFCRVRVWGPRPGVGEWKEN